VPGQRIFLRPRSPWPAAVRWRNSQLPERSNHQHHHGRRARIAGDLPWPGSNRRSDRHRRLDRLPDGHRCHAHAALRRAQADDILAPPRCRGWPPAISAPETFCCFIPLSRLPEVTDLFKNVVTGRAHAMAGNASEGISPPFSGAGKAMRPHMLSPCEHCASAVRGA